MKYLLRNLFLTVLLGYAISPIPLNPELFHLDLSRFSYENAVQNQARLNAITYSYELSGTSETLVNPDTSTFRIKAIAGKKPKWKSIPELYLSVLKDGAVIKTIPQSDFATYKEPSGGMNPYELVYQVKLSQKALQLDGTGYTFQIGSHSEALKGLKPISVNIQYMGELKYRAAVSEAPAGQRYVVLFYPDHSKKYSVPVSRIVSKSSKVFRHITEQWRVLPSADLNLSTELILPKVTAVRYNSGLVSCQFKEFPPALSLDPASVPVVQQSLRETILATETTLRIQKIQMATTSPSPVVGWVSDPTPVVVTPQLWLAMDNGKNTALLVPTALPVNSQQDAPTIIQFLKKGTNELLPTIPNHVQLIGSRMEGQTMVLNFSKNLKAVFAASPDQAALFLDSVANSIASLEGVESVRIQCDGYGIPSLGSIPVTDPLLPKRYVNPETVPPAVPQP